MTIHPRCTLSPPHRPPAFPLQTHPTRSTPSHRPRPPQTELFLKSHPPRKRRGPSPKPRPSPPHGPFKPLPAPRLRPIACLSPLLLPSGPRSTVHSSITPKGWKSLSTSSSDCCLLSMPTNSFRSPVGGATAHGPAEPTLDPRTLSPDPCCPRTFAQAAPLPVARG